jgi:hypothetical protein
MHDRVIMQNLPPARYPYVRQLNGQEIRLLKMQWPISDDQLSFALLEHPLEANIKFTALSYTWGSIDSTRTITCNGHPLQISQNLYNALKKLFAPDDFIWVDAICSYSYRTAMKCCRNLRFRPQFCEGCGFASERKNLCSVPFLHPLPFFVSGKGASNGPSHRAHCLDSNPQRPVRALGAPLGLGGSCQLHPKHVSAKSVAWKLRILLSAR